jgi:hypothetical protein
MFYYNNYTKPIYVYVVLLAKIRLWVSTALMRSLSLECRQSICVTATVFLVSESNGACETSCSNRPIVKSHRWGSTVLCKATPSFLQYIHTHTHTCSSSICINKYCRYCACFLRCLYSIRRDPTATRPTYH